MIRSGIISVHPRGFGFVMLEQDAGGGSAFVAPPDLNPFLAGDRVQAQIAEAPDGRKSATHLQLVARSRRTLFGQVVTHRSQPFLRVDREVANTDWRLAPSPSASSLPPDGSYAIARIQGDQVVCERAVAAQADPAFEQVLERYELMREAGAGIDAPPASGPDIGAGSRRRDLRDLPFVTIDAPSTRDIDDAIAVLPSDSEGALRLLVSIADVGAAVPAASALDQRARERATSVYLPDRVLPMLPPWLSEQQASLMQGAERNCLTVELRVDPQGAICSTDLYRSTIRSHARLEYEEVAAFLDRGETNTRTDPVREMLGWSRAAAARLSQARASRGGVELEADEMHIVVDPNTRCTTVVEPHRSTSAHVLIERFMVAANEAVAAWLAARGVPAPFRVHDAPDAQAVKRLALIAHNFGFEAGFGAQLTPIALAALQRQIHQAPAAPAILSVLAAALGPARYTAQRRAHFGLGAPLYLHFTSPIRRYADLLVHRAVGDYLDGVRHADPYPPELEQLCAGINVRARQAEHAERDCRRIASARYMASRVGQPFEGNIIAVRPFGLQVQLRATLIVGTVPTDALAGESFRIVDETREMVSASGTRLAVGMPVRVRTTHVDEMLGRVEFELV
jgi:ribonuclease R